MTSGRSRSRKVLTIINRLNPKNGAKTSNPRLGLSSRPASFTPLSEAMLAAKRYGLRQPVYTTGFSPLVEEASCVGCGKCAKVCPVDAIQMATGHIGEREHSVARIDYDICLGCGVCVRNCPPKCIDLKANDKKVLTPVNSTHRIVLAAIEKGQLANLVFDTPAFASHRAMGTLLTVILRLPPIKRAMASEQMKSKYLARLIAGRK